MPGLHFHFWPMETVEIVKVTEQQQNIGGAARRRDSIGRPDAVGRPEHRQRAVLGALHGHRSEGLSLQRRKSGRNAAAGRRKRHARSRRPPSGAGHLPRQSSGDRQPRCRPSSRARWTPTAPAFPSTRSPSRTRRRRAKSPTPSTKCSAPSRTKDRFVEEANQYANQKLGRARGQAAQIREEAAAYKDRVVKEAQGEAQRFVSVYDAICQGAGRDPQAPVPRNDGSRLEEFQQGHPRRQKAGRRALSAAQRNRQGRRRSRRGRQVMTSNRLPAILIGLAVLLFVVYSSVFVVNAREQAIVVRFGQIQDVKTEPGIYFKLPFAFMDADRVQYVENQALRFDLDNIRVQVSRRQVLRGRRLRRLHDRRCRARFRETVSGDRDVGRIASSHPSRCVAAPGLRSARLRMPLCPNERASMMREVRDDLQTRCRNARPQHRGRPHPPHRPDAGSLAADLRAHEGRASGRGRTASAPEVTKKASAAAPSPIARSSRSSPKRSVIRKSCAVRAMPSATAIFADAFARDPAFFEFYRSMTAYDAALGSRRTRRWCCRRIRSSSGISTVADGSPAAARRRRPRRRRRTGLRRDADFRRTSHSVRYDGAGLRTGPFFCSAGVLRSAALAHEDGKGSALSGSAISARDSRKGDSTLHRSALC